MDIPRGPLMVSSPPKSLSHRRQLRSHPPVASTIYPDSSPLEKGMAIPGTTTYGVPPPLPPPRYNHDLDEGVDIAWALQNEGVSNRRSALVPIQSGSSLLGALLHDQSVKDEDEDIDMDWDTESVMGERRMDLHSSQCQLTLRTFPPFISSPDLSYSASSPRLHGEQPLSRQNHNQFTHAYDKHMLLKIGKSTSAFSNSTSVQNRQKFSPPRLHIPNQETRELPELASVASTVSRNMPPLPSPVAAVKDSWTDQYENMVSHSASFSPASGLSNPFAGTPSIQTVPHEQSLRIDRKETSSGCQSDRSRRSSQDSTSYKDTSKEMPQGAESFRPALRLGTKRRALSPSIESVSREDRRSSQTSLHSTEPSTYRFDSIHPPHRTGSLSSTTSSAYPHSSASSYLLSATSSLTSASTLDLASLRTPSDFTKPDFSLRVATYNSDTAISSRKPPDTPVIQDTKSKTLSNFERPPSTRISPPLICSCCPKKPKKFENEKQLRHHEDEKQYACAFCNNRFKNKNEAERHQNSLHLRKQSWSCAAMTAYETAFQITTEGESPSLSYDVCGFCGVEFSNQPKDWNARIDHLVDLHKFGECNATKKFFRADHFRQHLKHSHAGKSGKWTNILENNCQREEAVPDPAGLSPSASDNSNLTSTGHIQSNSANPSDSGMSNSGVYTDDLHEGLCASST